MSSARRSSSQHSLAPAVPEPRIAVIGAGITGLAAAHHLREIHPQCRPVLLEAGDRVGGVLWTVEEQGYQVELSADNFITTVPWGVDLCRRLGLAGELTQTNTQHRQTYVVRRGRLHKLPDGFLMMAPTRMWPMALTPILSPWGKLRAACEYFLPPRHEPGDESMGEFVRRRLGREVFERLVEPLVSSVYAADMERLSVQATLAQFREMEEKYGSLIRAMRQRRATAPSTAGDTGARYSMFVTPRRGLSSIVEALAARMPDHTIFLNARVEQLDRSDAGHWLVSATGLGNQPFDGVILAAPSYEAGRLLTNIDPELATSLARIEHSGTAIVSVAYLRSQVAHPLNGMGVVVPAIERSPILACSFSSQKYEHRAPPGHVLLRIFAGGARHPELAEMPDGELVPLLLAELGKLLGIRGEPVYCRTAHWPRTMPQYHVGHKDRVQEIEYRVGALNTLRLAGNAYHGVGIPHCIHSGQQAAEAVLAALGHPNRARA